MDKFRMMIQFLQSNQESFMNGICGIMALAAAQLYSAFEFTCPCLPEYNYAYGVGVMVVPPFWFFMLGFVLNNNISMLAEEWKRPLGKRGKDPTVLRYMFISMSQRSLIAPIVWISVTLMDGKTLLCAYSLDLDASRFANVGFNFENANMTKEDVTRMLAKIPCKDIYDGGHMVTREAVTRYLRCVSQAFGWLFLLLITTAAFLIRAIRPCFNQAAFLKTKYWSHYIDIERKMFDDTCTEHAKSFAKVCIQQYFESISGEMRVLHGVSGGGGDDSDDEDKRLSDEDKLLGIRAQDDMNRVLWNWHTCKPPLSLKRDGPDGDTTSHDEHLNVNVNGNVNGNGHYVQMREMAEYYSTV